MTLRKINCILIPLVILIILSLTLLGACSAPATTPDGNGSSPPANGDPFPSTSDEPTVAWIADGVISDGEYAGSNSYDEYHIFWRADEQFVYIGIMAETTGWVAMAVQPGSTMKDADIIIGFVDGSQAAVNDQYSTGAFGPHSPDSELGGSNDILQYGGSESGGLTIIEFQRRLDTGDAFDHPLSAGTNKIIWSYSPSDNIMNKHAVRGYGEIIL